MFKVLKSPTAQKSCVATIKEKVVKISLTVFLLLFGLFVFSQEETNSDYQKGLKALESENYTEAIDFFDKEIKSCGNEISGNFIAKVYNSRGNANYKLKKYPDAIIDFSKAIEADKSYAKSYYEQGTVRAKIAQTEKALKDAIGFYDKAIELVNIAQNSNDSTLLKNTYYNRGNVKFDLDEYPEAIMDYKKAINFSKTESTIIDTTTTRDALYNIGLIRIEQKKYEVAIKSFEKIINLEPKYSEAHVAKTYVEELINN